MAAEKKTQNCNLCICSSVQFLSANASDFIRPIPDLGPVDEVWEYVHLLYQTLRCLPSGTVIIIITKTMFMVLSSWQSHCESSPGSFDECRMALSGRRPKTKPDDLGCESAYTGCQKLHPPSPFIITQPESWYLFYRPTEGRRLSRPSWLQVSYRDGLPVHRRSPIRILTGSDVVQLRWSSPTRYH